VDDQGLAVFYGSFLIGGPERIANFIEDMARTVNSTDSCSISPTFARTHEVQ